MTLAPLLSASPEIKLHAFAAMAALALGVVQLAAPNGLGRCRHRGYVGKQQLLLGQPDREYYARMRFPRIPLIFFPAFWGRSPGK